MSYDSNSQDKSENISTVSQVQCQDYEDEEVFSLQDNYSIVGDTSDWGLHDSSFESNLSTTHASCNASDCSVSTTTSNMSELSTYGMAEEFYNELEYFIT